MYTCIYIYIYIYICKYIYSCIYVHLDLFSFFQVIAQGCHAVAKVMWEMKDHENVIKYCSEIDSMHKVGVCVCFGYGYCATSQSSLDWFEVDHFPQK